MSMYTIKEIINLIERVQDSMGICDPMVYPSPVRALDVHALLTVARENIQLQAKIAEALAVPVNIDNPISQEAAGGYHSGVCRVQHQLRDYDK